MHKTKDSCLARGIRCPRGKEENTTVASLNRKSNGRFWCVHQQLFPQFTSWLQDFIYATQDHLGCRNIDERLLHLFPVFIINVVIRPSNPCHRDTALCSAHRNSPYSIEIPAPRTSRHPASHSHQGSNTIPSSSGRWDFFPNQPAAVGDVLYPTYPTSLTSITPHH